MVLKIFPATDLRPSDPGVVLPTSMARAHKLYGFQDWAGFYELATYFGITYRQAEWLFSNGSYRENVKPDVVANRVESFVKRQHKK